MATGLPSQTQVIELLDAEFARAGFEIENVVIDARAPLPRITVVVDGDTPLDLDTAAALSRRASDLLDSADGGGSYVLEVSSPGVERPLTSPKHFRRARGRKVELRLSDGSELVGRIGEVDEATLTLVIRAGRDWELRQLPLAEITDGVVQIEFSSPAERELALAQGRITGTGGGR
ncbi:MAG TPA: ribosome maturation factor RimP [Mycobacterium sp.]|nr:ribosome maturation factor RimP [Mycobacterium sp.]